MCKHIGWLILAVFLVAGGCDTNILGRRVDLVMPDALRPEFRDQVDKEKIRAA